MSNTALQRVEAGLFALSGSLDMDSVGPLVGMGRELFAAENDIRVDLQAVERSGSAGIALLLEWMRYAQAQGKQIRFINMPQQMNAIARVSGLADLISSK